MSLPSLQVTLPHPTPYEMSDAPDPVMVPVAAAQVKLGGWSRQGGGGGSLHSCQYQELQVFLSLLGESPWSWPGGGGCEDHVWSRCERWDLNLPCRLCPFPSQVTPLWQAEGWVMSESGFREGSGFGASDATLFLGVSVTPVSPLPPEHSLLQEFLSKDPCFQISDKVRGHSEGGGGGSPGAGCINGA